MKNTNLDKRYKDRDPLETVQLVKDFFASRGLTTQEVELISMQDSPNIFRSQVYLYCNDISFGHTCGKGTTKEFCQASGYAELYERFCNGDLFRANIKLYKIIQDLRHQTKGYYWDPNEKFLTYDELLINDHIKQIYSNWYSNPEKFIRLILDNKFIGIPYSSIQGDEIKYYNQRIITNFSTSNGMSAGNDLCEALVQGISELFERKAIHSFIYDFNTPIYYIDKGILSDNNKKIIKEIESTNKEVQIFDLSYTTNYPVVMTAIKHLDTNSIAVNFASNPIFDIAVERTLTEIYQYLTVLEDPHLYQDNLNFLDLSKKSEEDLKYIVSHPDCNVNIIPEFVFINAKFKNTYNSECFLNSELHSNEELLDFIKQFCKKTNINIYYHNNSLCDKLTAVHIFSPELSEPVLVYPRIDTDHIIDNVEQFYHYDTYSLEWLNTRNACAETIDFTFRNEVVNEEFIRNCWVFLGESKSTRFEPELLTQFYQETLLSKFRNLFIDYSTYFRYRAINKYSIEKTTEILNYFNKSFEKEKWDNCINIKYLITNILFKAISTEFSKEDLIEICKKLM